MNATDPQLLAREQQRLAMELGMLTGNYEAQKAELVAKMKAVQADFEAATAANAPEAKLTAALQPLVTKVDAALTRIGDVEQWLMTGKPVGPPVDKEPK